MLFVVAAAAFVIIIGFALLRSLLSSRIGLNAQFGVVNANSLRCAIKH